ncbi:MAG: hypothetical protein ACE5JZ_11305, partial [Kiloniellales bacterium]
MKAQLRPRGAARGWLDFGSGDASSCTRAGLLAAMLALAGCSWSSFTDLWGGEEEVAEDPTVATEERTEAAADIPGEHGAYPNLGSVPDRTSARDSGQLDRATLTAGLVADRANARYSDQIVRRDGAMARVRRAASEPPPSPASATQRTTAVLGAEAGTAAPEVAAAVTAPAPPSVPAVPPTPVQSTPIAAAQTAGSEVTSAGSST